ncbi:MAG: FAD binding domain-containing protein [Rhodospirillaceae bacterium]|nr:FAD binding domain-containing protein [Rhodospirillaceae bacterium]
MKPAPFDYVRAESVDEAVAVLAEHGDEARVLAGGQSLMPMLNMRLVRPEILVDISGLPELAHIEAEGDAVTIGASITQGELADWPELETALPAVAAALPHVGHFQTRNRGTVCGSICHADPSSELPLCLALLGGEVELHSARGVRTVPADEFQQGVLTTAKEPDELVARTRLPKAQDGERFAFLEFQHRHGDFAVVAVAARRAGDSVSLAVGGVADRPEVCHWSALPGDAVDDALNDLAWALGGGDDIHATARHRRQLVRHLGKQAIDATAAVGAGA